MSRFVPKNYYSGELSYVTTIAAAGGDLEQLMASLNGSNRLSLLENKRVPLTSAFHCYIADKSETGISFDIYAKNDKTKDSRTTTAKFRSELGWLLTVLLQTGYTVCTTDIKTMRHAEHPFRLDSD